MNANNHPINERFADLVIAMLAVNGWHLDKVGDLMNSLEQNGLTNPNTVASRAFTENAKCLESAGYSRGDYMVSMLTERIESAAQYFINHDNITKLADVEASRDLKRLRECLEPIKGVGKMVIENYALLRGLI
jgi:endonuclease III-like uncharacterized protein